MLDRVTETAAAEATQDITALALDLVQRAAASPGGLVLVDATGDRLARLATAAAVFDPALEILVLPAWDSLPYDRSPPSAAVIGRRVATLLALRTPPAGPRLLLTSVRAMLGRLPPTAHWESASLVLTQGDAIDPAAIGAMLGEWGYGTDEHVDEPGQVAVRGHVLDVFPGDAAAPIRVTVADGQVESIHAVDGATQRTVGDALARLSIHPVVEIGATAMLAGPEATEDLVGAAAYLGGMSILLHPEAETRWAELLEEVEDAHAATLRARRVDAEGARYVPPPTRLY